MVACVVVAFVGVGGFAAGAAEGEHTTTFERVFGYSGQLDELVEQNSAAEVGSARPPRKGNHNISTRSVGSKFCNHISS